MKKSLFTIMTLCLMMLFAFKVDVAAISSLKLKTTYRNWLSNHTEYYNASNSYYRGRLVFVDINGDGLVEALYSELPGKQIVLSYNKKTKKVKAILNKQLGHTGALYYYKKKHMICVSGDMEHEQKIYFYKISGLKANKKKEMEYYSVDTPNGNSYTRSYVYLIDSSKVSLKTYNKELKKAKKGYKRVTRQ